MLFIGAVIRVDDKLSGPLLGSDSPCGMMRMDDKSAGTRSFSSSTLPPKTAGVELEGNVGLPPMAVVFVVLRCACCGVFTGGRL